MKQTGKPKQFLELCGEPILIRTLKRFLMSADVDNVVVVCLLAYIDVLNDMIANLRPNKKVYVVPGGKTGQESIFNGLRKIKELAKNKDDLVIIHDGVRPFIKTDQISEGIQIAKKFGNCVAASPAIETIAIKGASNNVETIFNRAKCLTLKAPQIFRFEEILLAHVQAISDKKFDFVDSAQMMMFYGHKIHTMECDSTNIKITTVVDYFTAEGIVKNEEMQNVFGL